jgi:hypothetical protein
MSYPQDESSLDDLDFDLLVDGELGDQSRGELLARLDRVPGGWRRCALAFLEAQSWTQDLRAIRQESPATAQAPRPAPQRGAKQSRLGVVLAMAASFLIALGLGAYFRGFWSRTETWSRTDAMSRTDTIASPAPMAVAVSSAPQSGPVVPPGPVDSAGHVSPEIWQTVALPVADGAGGSTESMPLPARVADHLDPQWLDRFPPAMPRDVISALRESGHEVQQQRHLVPLPLQDGRRLVVPVDQVEVRYVGNSAYQ